MVPIQVIAVQVANEVGPDVVIEVVASNWVDRAVAIILEHELRGTVQVVVLLPETLGNDVESVEELGLSWAGVEIPVSAGVTYKEAFKFDGC